MALKVTYKGTDIIDETADCVKKLDTAGCYMEDDVTIDYTGGTAPTLITKNITANGTYNASSDNADGYSSVTVNVPDTAGLQAVGQASGVVTIPTGATSIRRYALESNQLITEVIIPNTVTSIGEYAFNDCRGILTIPNISSVTNFGTRAFMGCSAMSGELTFPQSASAVAVENFKNCRALTKIILHAQITIINRDAFNGCNALIEIDCTGLTVTNGTANTALSNVGAFTGTNDAPMVFATQEIMQVYAQASNWATYASRMTYVGA